MGGVVFDFNGKSVLVTGASRGIGYGIAEGFARAGADLTILADDAPVETAAAKLAAAMPMRDSGEMCFKQTVLLVERWLP